MRILMLALTAACLTFCWMPSHAAGDEIELPRRARVFGKIGLFRKPPPADAVAKPTLPRSADVSAAADADASPAPVLRPVDPEAIRLHLMDGSIVSGKFEVQEIAVETPFGALKIPLQSIRSFVPGLASYPDLHNQIQSLVEALGMDDYGQRESARKSLVQMGPQVEPELRRRLTDANPERVRHIKAILEEFAALEPDEEEAQRQSFASLDTVETTEFTVLGRISPLSFRFISNYGPLSIKLADIRRAERDTGLKEDLRKSLAVDGQNLAQRAFKNSGIRVARGDKVIVTANGTIHMTPWSQVSTPDGSENFGWYQQGQIPGGALVAKIGDSGKVFRVGSKLEFNADRSGTLQFGIAMQHQYARGNYQYPGKYDLKVKVEPK